MAFVSRGFRGRRRDPAESGRVPPGQYVVDDFPVLSAGPTPHTPLPEWSFSVLASSGDVLRRWTWDEFRALPSETITTDIHCVTKWSKLDTAWEGVPVERLFDEVEHDTGYVVAFCDGGYTTNLPLEDVLDGKAWVAFAYDGEPLEPEQVARPACSCPTCTSGRAPSGCGASGSWTRTSQVSGRPSAITCTETVAGAAVLGRLTLLAWRLAEVLEIVPETPRASTLVLEVLEWPGHHAGQHVDVRLTAEDGYQAQRSYSIASAPEDSALALTVERLPDGEVSPYLVEELRPGDRFELRGPIGGYFVWDAGTPGPLHLVAGGSGLVPLMAMLRHRAVAGGPVPVRLLHSARSLEDVLYREELERLAADDGDVHLALTLTRERPPGWTGYGRRVDEAMLAEVFGPPTGDALAFVCGPTRFVETAASGLVALGYDPSRVRTERFGPTGG